MEKIITLALGKYTEKELGNLLAVCRERSLLTQRNMAESLHFDRTHINKIEKGSRSVHSLEVMEPSDFIQGWLSVTDQSGYFVAEVLDNEQLKEALKDSFKYNHIKKYVKEDRLLA